MSASCGVGDGQACFSAEGSTRRRLPRWPRPPVAPTRCMRIRRSFLPMPRRTSRSSWRSQSRRCAFRRADRRSTRQASSTPRPSTFVSGGSPPRRRTSSSSARSSSARGPRAWRPSSTARAETSSSAARHTCSATSCAACGCALCGHVPWSWPTATRRPRGALRRSYALRGAAPGWLRRRRPALHWLTPGASKFVESSASTGVARTRRPPLVGVARRHAHDRT